MNEKRPEWFLDEFKHVGVDYARVETAGEYDQRHEEFRNFEEEAHKAADVLGLTKGSNLLDIGCGTGGLTVHLARRCRHVYAADVSRAMLAELTAKMEREGLTNFTPVHAGFLTYEHAGEPLDAIIATVTFHHLPDFWKQVALCRFHDMLKPGGLLYLVDVVFDFPPREYRERIDGWFESMRAVAGQHMGNEAVVHIRDEFSTWDWIMTGMLERAGFQVDRNFETLPLMRTYVCSKP